MFEGEGQMVQGDWGCIKYEKTLQIIGLVTEGMKQHSYLLLNILVTKYVWTRFTGLDLQI